MPRPTTRSELLEAMEREYAALWAEVGPIADPDRLVPGACDAWSIKDILAHLDAWHDMFLRWERAGAAGETIEMPAPGYTWKDTPALNDEIYQRIKYDDYDAVVARLEDSYRRMRSVVAGYSDEDLSAKRRYKWTGSTSVLSYAVSATSSHYDWACKLIRRFKKRL
jgi:hypothetical protein